VVEQHPAKTFIRRIDRGFDFVGYHFGPEGTPREGERRHGLQTCS
jgi:hypothetical protein